MKSVTQLSCDRGKRRSRRCDRSVTTPADLAKRARESRGERRASVNPRKAPPRIERPTTVKPSIPHGNKGHRTSPAGHDATTRGRPPHASSNETKFRPTTFDTKVFNNAKLDDGPNSTLIAQPRHQGMPGMHQEGTEIGRKGRGEEKGEGEEEEEEKEETKSRIPESYRIQRECTTLSENNVATSAGSRSGKITGAIVACLVQGRRTRR